MTEDCNMVNMIQSYAETITTSGKYFFQLHIGQDYTLWVMTSRELWGYVTIFWSDGDTLKLLRKHFFLMSLWSL